MATPLEQQQATESTALCSGEGEHQGRPEKKPDPVTRIDTTPWKKKKKKNIQIIDYYYEMEEGDIPEFNIVQNDDKTGFKARFSVTRSSSSQTRNVLDTSRIIPNDVRSKFSYQTKLKKKKECFRVKLIKTQGNEDLDLAKYFSGVRSSSDEEQQQFGGAKAITN